MDIHVLAGHRDTWKAVFHYPTLVGNNRAGMSWADALVASGLGGTTILPDGDGTEGTIDPIEKAAIVAGTRREHVDNYRIESGGRGDPSVLDSLRRFYARDQVPTWDKLTNSLKHFGLASEER